MPEYRDPATLCKDDNGGTPLSPQNWIVHIYERMRMSCLLRSPVCWHPASFPLFSSVFCMELRSGYFPLCAGSKRCALLYTHKSSHTASATILLMGNPMSIERDRAFGSPRSNDRGLSRIRIS